MQIMETKSTTEGDGQESNSFSSDKENEDCTGQSNIQNGDEAKEKESKNKTVICNNNDDEKKNEESVQNDSLEADSEETLSDGKESEEKDKESNKETEVEVDKNEQKENGLIDQKTNSTTEDNKNETKDIETEKEKSDNDNFQKSSQEDIIVPDNDTAKDTGEEDEEMDVDLDPTLLCPEVTMEEDENQQIVPNNDASLNDGSTSPELYQPMFSTLVDEITGAELSFNLTPEEEELRKQTYGPGNRIEWQKIHCTACNTHLGSALNGQSNRFVHPLLKVLVCKECYHFYTSGEFEKDEDGSELYCRWCGQGGSVLCCANCEFVFCKKCIRNNFGKRRLNEIKNSDDWKCFRCEPKVLEPIRVACYEFFQYFKRAMAEAQANRDPAFMSIDHTTCCTPKSKEEQQQQMKKKRRRGSVDPDYNPFAENRIDSAPPAKKSMSSDDEVKPILNKQPDAKPGTHTVFRRIEPITSQLISSLPPGSYIATSAHTGPEVNSLLQKQLLSFKIGTTNFKRVAIMNPASMATTPSTFPQPIIRMVSPLNVQSRMTRPPTVVQPPRQIPYTVVQQRPTVPTVGPQLQQQIRATPPPLARVNRARVPIIKATVTNSPSSTATSNIVVNPVGGANRSGKQEWFEKTLRAASRVNSDLSYTLSILNKQKSSANTVEKQAIVHNKLQEVLSTSINSLIQIRKNLRTDFITDIKTYRPPAAPVQPKPMPTVNETITLDDDVVFVNANEPTTSTSTVQFNSQSTIPIITSAVSLSPKKTDNNISTTTIAAKPTGGYLRVKSFSALQTVSSECITIPDDYTPKATEETKEKAKDDKPEQSNETTATNTPQTKNDIESSIVPADSIEVNDTSIYEEDESDKEKSDKMDDEYRYLLYNVKEEPSDLVKKMLKAKVIINRSKKIDKLCRKKMKHSVNKEIESV